MKKTKKALAVAAIICAAIASSILATWLSAIVEEEPPGIEAYAPANTDDPAGRQIDWDALPPEIVAWVEVPGTSIDEPVAQATPDAPNAYLHADAIGQGAYGTPYIDCEGSVDSRYVMVFEHHMSDGSAFADFASFIDEGYAREHAKIIVYRRKGETLNLRPVAVDVVNASRERLVIDQEAGFGKIVEGSDLILEEPVEDGQLFAFTTCSYQTRNSKTTVFAVWGYNAH